MVFFAILWSSWPAFLRARWSTFIRLSRSLARRACSWRFYDRVGHSSRGSALRLQHEDHWSLSAGASGEFDPDLAAVAHWMWSVSQVRGLLVSDRTIRRMLLEDCSGGGQGSGTSGSPASGLIHLERCPAFPPESFRHHAYNVMPSHPFTRISFRFNGHDHHLAAPEDPT